MEIRYVDMVDSMIKYGRTEMDEDFDKAEAIEELEDIFLSGTDGLKLFRIDSKKDHIVLQGNFNKKKLQEAIQVLGDYSDVIMDLDDFDKFKEVCIAMFSKKKNGTRRAKAVYNYYKDSGAIKGGDDTVFDELGSGVIVALDVLKMHLKKIGRLK